MQRVRSAKSADKEVDGELARQPKSTVRKDGSIVKSLVMIFLGFLLRCDTEIGVDSLLSSRRTQVLAAALQEHFRIVP